MKSAKLTHGRLGAVFTAPQLSFYRENGYFVFNRFADPETVTELLAAVKSAELYLLGNGVSKAKGTPVCFGRDRDGLPFLECMDISACCTKVLSGLMADQRIPVLCMLLGADAGATGKRVVSRLIVEHYTDGGNQVSWLMGRYRDCALEILPGRKERPLLRIGIPLDDFPANHGGLVVLPGSHRYGEHPIVGNRYAIDAQICINEAGLDLAAGDLTVYDGRLLQRVRPYFPGKQNQRRRILYISFGVA